MQHSSGAGRPCTGIRGIEESKTAQDEMALLENCCVMVGPGHRQSVEITAASGVKSASSAGVPLHLCKDKQDRRCKQKESSTSP